MMTNASWTVPKAGSCSLGFSTGWIHLLYFLAFITTLLLLVVLVFNSCLMVVAEIVLWSAIIFANMHKLFANSLKLQNLCTLVKPFRSTFEKSKKCIFQVSYWVYNNVATIVPKNSFSSIRMIANQQQQLVPSGRHETSTVYAGCGCHISQLHC